VLRAVTLQTGSIYPRERVTIRGDSIGRVLHVLRASGSAEEWLVLSTCGRTEVYAVTRGILDLAMPVRSTRMPRQCQAFVSSRSSHSECVLNLATRSRSDAVKDVERIVEEALVRMLAWSPHAQHTVSRLST
jgi:glutamyl-tRNA reductase